MIKRSNGSIAKHLHQSLELSTLVRSLQPRRNCSSAIFARDGRLVSLRRPNSAPDPTLAPPRTGLRETERQDLRTANFTNDDYATSRYLEDLEKMARVHLLRAGLLFVSLPSPMQVGPASACCACAWPYAMRNGCMRMDTGPLCFDRCGTLSHACTPMQSRVCVLPVTSCVHPHARRCASCSGAHASASRPGASLASSAAPKGDQRLHFNAPHAR